MENNDEIIKKKKRNFIIIAVTSVLIITMFKAYSNYRISQINTKLRTRRKN